MFADYPIEFVCAATNKRIQLSYRNEYSKINWHRSIYVLGSSPGGGGGGGREYRWKILSCVSVMLLEYIIIGEIFVLLLCANSKRKLQILVRIWCKSEHRNVCFNKQGINKCRRLVIKHERLQCIFLYWLTYYRVQWLLGRRNQKRRRWGIVTLWWPIYMTVVTDHLVYCGDDLTQYR
jgi:hypothetical protein